jgi:DNA-binding NarL/FixJ family response regulator
MRVFIDQGRIVIQVDDDGPGFGAGSGGLSSPDLGIVHDLISGHGGSLEIRPGEMGGARVRILLPAASHPAPGSEMRVLICDDHAVFADSLALVLGDAGCSVVGVTYTLDDALTVLRNRPADICLIDLRFPADNALDRLAELQAATSDTRFVVLSGFVDHEIIEAGVRAGAHGFAHKGQQASEILTILRRVHNGEVVIDRRRGSARPHSQAHRVAQFLTPREREVLTRLARGESTAALAKAMGVTRSAARSHVQSVLTKLGVDSQREAVIEATRNGLVSVETGEWLVS